MKIEKPKIAKVESIKEVHRMLNLPGPKHPLITLFDTRDERINLSCLPVSYVTSLYKISFIESWAASLDTGRAIMILTKAVWYSPHLTRWLAVQPYIKEMKVIH